MSGRILASLLIVLVVAGAIFAILSLLGPPTRVNAPPVKELAPNAAGGAELAQAACVRLGLAIQVIRADGVANTVRTELAASRRLAAAAFRRDARYAALSGGIAALDEAVRLDDGEAAALAVRIALDHCAE